LEDKDLKRAEKARSEIVDKVKKSNYDADLQSDEDSESNNDQSDEDGEENSD